jgi:ketosteroid isomerase-like protein
MNEQQNLRVVNLGYEAYGRGDLDALLGLFDEDIEWVSPGPPELATSGRRRGLAQVAEFFRSVNELFEFERFEPSTFVADADRVIVLGEYTGRFKPTGAVISEPWAHAFTLRDGKIIRFQEYTDTASVVAQAQAARARA